MAKLRLQFVCDESWDDMQRVPGGRFCDRCEKRVVDFTKMNEREALVVASLFQPGSLCGRLPAMFLAAALATGCSVPAVVATADPVAQTAKAAPSGDIDHDGIPDKNDQCPTEPEDRDGFQDDDGCPDPDNDKDGIPDSNDKCPNEPETYNGLDDDDGCPDRGGIVIIDSTVTIVEKISFDANSDTIAKSATPTLDTIATTLKAHPELGTILVKGHSLKSEKDGAKLAERRAKNVIDALVKRGVDRAVLDVRTAEDGQRVDFEVAPKASCPKP